MGNFYGFGMFFQLALLSLGVSLLVKLEHQLYTIQTHPLTGPQDAVPLKLLLLLHTEQILSSASDVDFPGINMYTMFLESISKET